MFGLFGKSGAKKSVADVLAEIESAGLVCASESARKLVMADVQAQGEGQLITSVAILCVMGAEQWEPETFRPLPWLSPDVWHFDFEAIEDHGHYKAIVERCAELAGGELDIADVTDFVDIENDTAWVDFTQGGARRRIHLRVDNDWADPMLFVQLNKLLSAIGSKRQFAEHDLGQDCLIVCRSASDIAVFNKSLGLSFRIFEA